MAAIVFDDCGRLWTSASQAFGETFSIPKKEVHLTKYAVKPLGFVAIDQYRGSVQLRCALAIVSEAAIASAFEWLRNRKFERIAIDYYDGAWKLMVATSSEAAIAKLQALLAASPRALCAPIMHRQLPIEPGRLGPSFEKLHTEWRAAMAGLVPYDIVDLARRHLGERFVIYAQGSDGRLYFDVVGKGFPHFGTAWANSMRGRPMSDQPDPGLAKTAEALSLEAIEKNEARFHDLDVLVSNTEGKRVRVRFKRLVLPVIEPGQPVKLISGTMLDEPIDLRQDALDSLRQQSNAA